jgi:hypothetical protein
MSDLHNRIASQHAGLDRLIGRLPGFRGYQDATDRRAADRMIREHIGRALHDQYDALMNASKAVLNSPNGLALMSRLGEVQTRMMTFINRVNTAMPGYAGFYDALKIGPAELQKLYDFDASLLSFADQFKEKVDALQTAVTTKEGLDAAITALDTLTNEANAAFGARENVITGIR